MWDLCTRIASRLLYNNGVVLPWIWIIAVFEKKGMADHRNVSGFKTTKEMVLHHGHAPVHLMTYWAVFTHHHRKGRDPCESAVSGTLAYSNHQQGNDLSGSDPDGCIEHANYQEGKDICRLGTGNFSAYGNSQEGNDLCGSDPCDPYVYKGDH